jgi:uncharacterized protein YutE (UPF0331/DUF86 family)
VAESEVIRRRLSRLEEYLGVLDSLRHYTREEFEADPLCYGSAERFLQLAIETVNDVAARIVVRERLGVVEEGRDLPRLFHENEHIGPDLAERWAKMIGFRNVLVHEYLEIDRSIVNSVLQGDLGDLKLLAAVLARFL